MNLALGREHNPLCCFHHLVPKVISLLAIKCKNLWNILPTPANLLQNAKLRMPENQQEKSQQENNLTHLLL